VSAPLTKQDVLTKLNNLREVDGYIFASAFLGRESVVALDAVADKKAARVGQILHTWIARLENAENRGIALPGLASYVAVLRRLPAETELQRLAFQGDDLTGLFFFLPGSVALVGFVIAGHRILNVETDHG